MVSQWRYALRRRSRRNSGSFFRDEISRMTPSLSPFGTVSASTDVTNPQRYSLSTHSLTCSVAFPMSSPNIDSCEGWYPGCRCHRCLLYTSDAADDLLCVDLGGRR